jgi:D-lactate dehydrogenase
MNYLDKVTWVGNHGAFFHYTHDYSRLVVSLHAPLNDSTYHMINKDALQKMKHGAMLINTSRGPLVDAQALVDCLKASKLRGAALDVYEHEEKYFYKDFSQQVPDSLL